MTQVVGQGVGHPFRIKRFAAECDHFFLGAPNEMVSALPGRELVECLIGGQCLGFQQPPQRVIGIIFTHVGCGGQQEKVVGMPRQLPFPSSIMDAGNGLGQAIAGGFSDAKIITPITGKLVGLVKYDQIVRFGPFLFESGIDPFSGQGIDADNQAVAIWPLEWIVCSNIASADNTELEMKQRGQFPLPVSHQTGRCNDQNTAEQSAGQHFANIEPCHDRLAGTGIIGQEKP